MVAWKGPYEGKYKTRLEDWWHEQETFAIKGGTRVWGKGRARVLWGKDSTCWDKGRAQVGQGQGKFDDKGESRVGARSRYVWDNTGYMWGHGQGMCEGKSMSGVGARSGPVWEKGRACVRARAGHIWGQGQGTHEDKGGAHVDASANLV